MNTTDVHSNKMDKTKLKELKRLLPTLSEKEAKRVMEAFDNGEKTGYATVDRPWDAWYENIDKVDRFLNTTAYQGMIGANKDYPDEKALDFFGTKITFGEMSKNIDIIAKSLKEYGVKKGDYVTVCAVATPELIYTFYAISKIGAVAQMISPFFNPNDIADRISECESKLVIVMDKFYPLFKETLNKKIKNNIVVLPLMNSSVLKYVTKSLKVDSKQNELTWKQFVKDGKYQINPSMVEYEKNQPVAMVYSSGTTGAAKGIVLSNDSFQKVVNAYGNSGFNTSRGQVVYQNIPPWSSTGISLSINFPLSYGVSIYLDPRFDQNVFVKNVLKSKPNYILTTTTMYQGLITEKNLKRLKNKDLSFLKYPVEGGEKLTPSDIDNIERVLHEHGSNSHLLSGYGLCECGSTITTDIAGKSFPRNSSGIPLPEITTIAIFDDNNNELKYNTRGNIVAKTDIGMSEYFNNKEKTDEFFYTDVNGEKWSKTGDIGYINEDGSLVIEGRKKDCSIINGKHVYNFDIENAILTLDFVDMCEVQTLPSDSNTLFAHLIFNKEMKEKIKNGEVDEISVLKTIKDSITPILKDLDFVPNLYKIDNEFPMAISGKRDIKKLKEDCMDLIEVKNDEKVLHLV